MSVVVVCVNLSVCVHIDVCTNHVCLVCEGAHTCMFAEVGVHIIVSFLHERTTWFATYARAFSCCMCVVAIRSCALTLSM